MGSSGTAHRLVNGAGCLGLYCEKERWGVSPLYPKCSGQMWGFHRLVSWILLPAWVQPLAEKATFSHWVWASWLLWLTSTVSTTAFLSVLNNLRKFTVVRHKKGPSAKPEHQEVLGSWADSICHDSFDHDTWSWIVFFAKDPWQWHTVSSWRHTPFYFRTPSSSA